MNSSVAVPRIESVADSMAQTLINAGVTPGITVAVAKNGKAVFARGYGNADIKAGAPPGPETVYKIGSVTKQFTAAIIMRLSEAGKISPDDSITKFLPDYPVQGHQVTVHHLLNHTSGIKSFELNEDGGKLFARNLSYREMVDRFGRQRFDFKPGEKFEYNNMAYYLLGEIIRRVTGIPYADYVERELLRPLGLSRTLHLSDRRNIANLARGYARTDDKFIDPPYVNARMVAAAGALCSTAGDLVRWTDLLHSGKVVSPASLRQMTTPTVLSGTGEKEGYGYGLFIGELEGHRKIYHGGAGLGFLSLVSHYPEDGLTIVVLMNTGLGKQKRDEVEAVLARAALGLQVRDLPLTAEDIARYEGTYVVQAGAKTFELRVFGEGATLNAQLVGGSVVQLRYQGDHRFVGGKSDDIRVTFEIEKERGQNVTVNLRGQILQGKRKV